MPKPEESAAEPHGAAEDAAEAAESAANSDVNEEQAEAPAPEPEPEPARVFFTDTARIDELVAQFQTAYGHPESQAELERIAKHLFADAITVRDTGDTEGAVRLLVRSVELNPRSGEASDELERLLGNLGGPDMTKRCMIFPDVDRATRFYGDAFQTALDYATFGGVIGDVLEFGVLGGWTARLIAERMRTLQFYGDLHLFDSFAGLPRQKIELDAASYDVTRGIWDTEMDLPEALKAELGERLPVHIERRLSEVISGERIHVREGFFSETLAEPLRTKAAIVHLDCDLYQSTQEVLDALHRDSVLQDGTVLMFDDWNCNKANPAFGQRRALSDFLSANAERYAVSHYFNYGFNCAAFILHDLHGVDEALREDARPYFTTAGSFAASIS
ncbi:TylF/MycF/NovP-related O-methyltransferase [Aurantimonas coralicida]